MIPLIVWLVGIVVVYTWYDVRVRHQNCTHAESLALDVHCWLIAITWPLQIPSVALKLILNK